MLTNSNVSSILKRRGIDLCGQQITAQRKRDVLHIQGNYVIYEFWLIFKRTFYYD